MYNYRIATILGIPIRINISLLVFLPVLAWLIGSGEQLAFYSNLVDGIAGTSIDVGGLQAGNMPWIVGSAAALGLFASVGVHELGHALAARRYDIETESITLWILGGLASLERMPKEPGRELVIALAGPAASVLTAVVCFAALFVIPASANALVFVVGWLAVTNVILTVFNLLPAFPMDGGRVLRSFLARYRSYPDATRIAARIGVIFAVVFALVGIFNGAPMLLLLAIFVYSAANGESRIVALEAMLDGFVVGDVYRDDRPTVRADESLGALSGRVLQDRETEHVVVDDDGRVVGLVDVEALRGKTDEEREPLTVGDVAKKDLPTVEMRTPAFEALRTMDRGEHALVTDDDGVVGVLSRGDFSTLFELTNLSKRDRMAQ